MKTSIPKLVAIIMATLAILVVLVALSLGAYVLLVPHQGITVSYSLASYNSLPFKQQLNSNEKVEGAAAIGQDTVAIIVTRKTGTMSHRTIYWYDQHGNLLDTNNYAFAPVGFGGEFTVLRGGGLTAEIRLRAQADEIWAEVEPAMIKETRWFIETLPVKLRLAFGL